MKIYEKFKEMPLRDLATLGPKLNFCNLRTGWELSGYILPPIFPPDCECCVRRGPLTADRTTDGPSADHSRSGTDQIHTVPARYQVPYDFHHSDTSSESLTYKCKALLIYRKWTSRCNCFLNEIGSVTSAGRVNYAKMFVLVTYGGKSNLVPIGRREVFFYRIWNFTPYKIVCEFTLSNFKTLKSYEESIAIQWTLNVKNLDSKITSRYTNGLKFGPLMQVDN